MEQVDIRFQYMEQEFVKAVRKYLLATGTIKKVDMVLAVIGVPCALIYWFISPAEWLSVLLLVCTIVLSGVIGFLYFFGPVLSFRKTPKYGQEYHLNFSEERILFETAEINSELKWEIYTALLESEDCYYLVQTKQIYSVVPKRAFAGDAEKLAFERMAEQGTKSTKRNI